MALSGTNNSFNAVTIGVSKINSLKLVPQPAIALLCLNSAQIPDLPRLIEIILALGCIHIACFGSAAEDLEDRIDAILESGSQKVDVITTAHANETIDEVMNFILYGAMVQYKSFRAFCVFDDDDRSLIGVVEEFGEAAAMKVSGAQQV